MKAKYRKFVIGRHKYCFWLRFYQTLFYGVKDSSKANTDCRKQARKQKDYEHKQRRKLSRKKKKQEFKKRIDDHLRKHTDEKI